METRANFVLIGGFTLGVIAACFLFVLWLAGFGHVSDTRAYRVVFTGSVSGLARGSLVLFNGLHIGEVTDMDFLPNDPGRVAATIVVQNRIPIKQDTKARLELQGLTGGAAVGLTGGALDSPALPAKDGEPPTIIAEPSQIQDLLVNVQNISSKADAVLSRADKLFSDNGPVFTDTLHNINTFSKALGDASSGLGGVMSGVADIGRKIGPLAQRLEKLTDDVDKLVVAVDADKVKKAVSDLTAFSASLGDSKGPTQAMLNDAATLVKRLSDSSVKLTSVVSGADNLIKAFDTKKVSNLMDGADALGDALKQNKGNIDTMIKDAASMVAKLNASADKIDGLMTSVQGFVSSPDTKGPIGQLGDAAKSIRVLADDLNSRVKELSVGLLRFTGTGLREYEALAVDGRRTIDDVDRVVRSFEKNPSQIIFGAKPALPEFHGN